MYPIAINLGRLDGLDDEFDRFVRCLEELQVGVGSSSKPSAQHGNQKWYAKGFAYEEHNCNDWHLWL